MRPIDADELLEHLEACLHNGRPLSNLYDLSEIVRYVKSMPTVAASPWHRVEEPPKEAGEYIVAYHPCWWDDVKTQVTKVGIDSFRGKASWAKRKRQRVTHWMEKPEPPKED